MSTAAASPPTGIVVTLPTGWGRTALTAALAVVNALPWLIPTAWFLGYFFVIKQFPPARAWRDPSLQIVLIPTVVVCLVWTFFYPNTLPRLLARLWLGFVVRHRADAVVSPDDSTALFVRLLPGKSWVWPRVRGMRFGFLVADPESGYVLYEGDDRRWVLPAGSVRSVQLNDNRLDSVTLVTSQPLATVVIEARQTGSDPLELAVGPWPGGLLWVWAEIRGAPAATALRDRIAAVALTDSGDGDESAA
jgi:hypothetical protein